MVKLALSAVGTHFMCSVGSMLSDASDIAAFTAQLCAASCVEKIKAVYYDTYRIQTDARVITGNTTEIKN